MAVRQYIGARYVPAYVGQWNASNAYEPLSIVTDGTGNSWTSKKVVPPGTPLQEGDFWALTGVYSGQILQLENRMQVAENEIDALDDNVDTISTNIVSLQADVEVLKNKKIVFVADSYGTRVDTDGNTVPQILRNAGFDIVFDYSYGGAGFTKTGDYDIKSYPGKYTGNKQKVTDVIYACSANDTLSDLVSIRNSVIAGINVAKTLYPNAKIHVIPWGCHFKDTQEAANLIRVTLPAYKFACNSAGALCLDNAEYVLKNTALLENDWIHPNGMGVAYLARAVASAITGSTFNVEYDAYITAEKVSNEITSFASQPLLMRRRNGIVTLELDSNDISNSMFVVEHSPGASGDFKPQGVAIRLSQSLFSTPRTYMNGRGGSLHGMEGAAVGGGSPVYTFGATMNFEIVTNEMFIAILPDMPSYPCLRFISKDISVIMMD